jgi:hypothetical protein
MLAAAMGVILWVGPAMAGDDVESELAEMRRLMEGLQQKVDAQEEELAQQGRNLEEAQSVVRRTQEDAEAVSGLSSFLNSLEVDGHVAVSYAYNVINNPDNSPFGGPGSGAIQPGGGNDPTSTGLNGGGSGAFLPFHSDHDSFEVDQIWFGLGKPSSEESRAGFRFDLTYGSTASALGNLSPAFSRALTTDSTNDFYVVQAYLEYLAPIGNGVTFTAGKFGSLAGAEVAKTTDNFNITMGNLYNLLQPIDHVGFLASTDVGPLNITLGAANSQTVGVGTVDDNSEKTLIAQVGMGDDALSGVATVYWGAEAGSNKDDLGILDIVVRANPTDDLSLWLNADVVWSDGSAFGTQKHDSYAYGLAAAGRMALSEKMGFALRGEYVWDNSGRVGLRQAVSADGLSNKNNVWSLTATIDYTVVEDLLLRLESRYDYANQSQFYNSTGNGIDNDQWVLLAQAVYNF